MPGKKRNLPPAPKPSPVSTAGFVRTTVLVPPKTIEGVDRVIELLGVGDRSSVFRQAATYGVAAFLEDPSLVGKVPEIRFKKK